MSGWQKVSVASAGVAAVVGIPLGAIFLVGGLQKGTADFRGDVGQTESVHADADYRIAAYDRFFDLCGAVQAVEDKISIQEAELATAEPDRRAFVAVDVSALKQQRAELIREYNADAAKTDTRANFLSSTLPYHLNIEEQTRCVV